MKNKYNYIVAILFAVKIICEFSQSINKSDPWNVLGLVCGAILVIGFIENNKVFVTVSLIPGIIFKTIVLGQVVVTEVQSLRASIPWPFFQVLFMMNFFDVLHETLYFIAILTKKHLYLYLSSVSLIISALVRFNGFGFGTIVLVLLFVNVFAIIFTKDTIIIRQNSDNSSI